MARVNVDQKALLDPRFTILGAQFDPLQKEPEETVARAVGLYYSILLWNWCTEHGKHQVPRYVIEAIHTRLWDALLSSDLGIEIVRGNEQFMRIRGTKGRIEWYKKVRDGNRKRQQKHREMSRVTAALVTRESRGSLALALSPALSLIPESLTPPLSSPQGGTPMSIQPAAEVDVTVPTNGGKPKRAKPRPKPPDDPQLLAWFDSLYAIYPKHEAKAAGWKAFKALKPTPELLDVIADDIEARIADGRFNPDQNWKFTPAIGPYLNQQRWKDTWTNSKG